MKVTEAFDGVPDGAVYPRHFAVGSDVFGALAEVAKAEGWATDDSDVVDHKAELAGAGKKVAAAKAALKVAGEDAAKRAEAQIALDAAEAELVAAKAAAKDGQ